MPDATAIITALILERPLCLPCLIDKSGFTFKVIGDTVDRMASVVAVHRETRRCHACGETVETVSVSRPSQ